jgi:lipopolysaccharide/colanic/teichoic acid biosynthesis glycosyltransferase
MFVKRIFDIIASSLGLLFLLPVFIVTAFILIISNSWPIMFYQNRIGLNMKPFLIYKFRTMRLNKSKVSITLKNDVRITSFGKFLRKSKIDELPQLINILKGEMSVVGPRPDVPEYSLKLKGEDQIIFNMKPGLTGADSVYYPDEEKLLEKKDNPIEYYNKVIWPHKVSINRNYINHWSFWLDIKIIIHTIIGRKLNDSRFN